MTGNPLPDDLFTPDAGLSPAEAWLSLNEQSGAARARRTDLVGAIAAEEKAQGASGWRERVQNRLSLEGHEPVGLKVISDGSKIFDLFRVAFRWPITRVSEVQPGRLRVFAQNAEWAAANPDTVEEMLASGVNEGKMRKAIQEAIVREANGGELPEQEQWTNVTLRFKPSDASIFLRILEGVRHKKKEVEGEEFSANKNVELAQLALVLAAEWYNNDEVYDDGAGGDIAIPNSKFVPEEASGATRQAAD